MGRVTFESIGKALPGRRNLVVSSQKIEVPGIEVFSSVGDALHATLPSVPVYFVGGLGIYEEAILEYATHADVTYVPDVVEHPEAVRFPVEMLAAHFEASPLLDHEDEPTLKTQFFTRKDALP